MIDILPGESSYVVEDRYALPTDVVSSVRFARMLLQESCSREPTRDDARTHNCMCAV